MAQEFLEQFILGDVDDEVVPATPTSELENRFLIFQKLQFDRDQLEFYQAFEERLNEAGGQYLRPHALRRGGQVTVCNMLLFSLLGAVITTESYSVFLIHFKLHSKLSPRLRFPVFRSQ